MLAIALLELSNISVATLGQKPNNNVGDKRLNAIKSYLEFISSTIASAGILGPKNTLRHMESRYIGVSTRPIAAIKIEIDLNDDEKMS